MAGPNDDLGGTDTQSTKVSGVAGQPNQNYTESSVMQVSKAAEPVARPADRQRDADSGDDSDGPQIRPIPATIDGRRRELEEARGLGPAPFVSGEVGVQIPRDGGGPPIVSPIEFKPGSLPTAINPNTGERVPVELGEDGKYRIKPPDSVPERRPDGQQDIHPDFDRSKAGTLVAEPGKILSEAKDREQQVNVKEVSSSAAPPGMIGDKEGSELAVSRRAGDNAAGLTIKLGDLIISGKKLILGDGKDGIALDLSTRKSREYIFDLLTRLHTGKLDGADHRGVKILEGLRNLDQDKLDGLRQLIGREFVEGVKPGRGTKFADDLLGKIREIIDKGPDSSAGDRGGREIPSPDKSGRSLESLTLIRRLATDKLIDFTRANSEIFKSGDVRNASTAALIELGRILRDIKDEPGKEGVTLKDMLSANFKSGERVSENTGFRLAAQQESMVRSIIDKVSEARVESAQRGDTRSPGDVRRFTEDFIRPGETAGVKIEVPIPSVIDISTSKLDDTASVIQTMGQLEGMALPGSDEEEEELKRRKEKEDREQREARDKEEAEAGQAAEAALAAQKLREMDELQERERLERQEKEWQERLEREARERREREEREKLKQKQRKKYKVRKNDTLESIAFKQLGNEGLARLIYDLNRASIPVVTQGGKRLLNLQPGIVLWLPAPADIEDFQNEPFTGVQARFEYLGVFATPEEELAAAYGGSAADYASGAADDVTAKARKAIVERALGPVSGEPPVGQRMKYIVRLGDTLKSIAIKHPALEDVALWKLLAEVNELSAEVDPKGTPVVLLKRGMTIFIPTAEDINSYKMKQQETNRAPQPDLPPKNCPVCSRPAHHKAILCPGCGHNFQDETAEENSIVDSKAVESHYAPTSFGPSFYDDLDVTSVILQAAGMLPVAEAITTPAVNPSDHLASTGSNEYESPSGPERATIRQLGESTRLVKVAGGSGGLDAGFRLRLELKVGSEWKSVVTYEVYDDVSLRHEFMLDGKRTTKRIDLPPPDVQALAENDLLSNWQNYVRNFQAGRGISD